jgi:hypothetical protein
MRPLLTLVFFSLATFLIASCGQENTSTAKTFSGYHTDYLGQNPPPVQADPTAYLGQNPTPIQADPTE